MSDLEAPHPYARLVGAEVERASFAGGSVIQLVDGDPSRPGATVVDVYPATVVVTSERLVAVEGDLEWEWYLEDLEEAHHGGDEPWTIVAVPGVSDHGVAVPPGDVAEFRRVLTRARAEAGRPPTRWGTEPGADPNPVEDHPSATVPVEPDRPETEDDDVEPDGGVDLSPPPPSEGPPTDPGIPSLDGELEGAGEPDAATPGRVSTRAVADA